MFSVTVIGPLITVPSVKIVPIGKFEIVTFVPFSVAKMEAKFNKVVSKRGFNNYEFRTVYSTVNVSDLNRFEDGTVVDIALLKEVGLIKKELDGVKVLGSGELTKKLTVKANAFTKSAQEKIETIGGKTEVI